jgi:secondary thiamine-phosphate synthase enzyme
MRQMHGTLDIDTSGQGLYEVTHAVRAWVCDQRIGDGLLTLFCRHTSASLTIQENADPDVLRDLCAFFARLVQEEPALYRHTAEGADDMPAHIRSALTAVQLAVPIQGGRPALGTWQGIYLFEHRRAPHQRQVAMHLLGD